LEASLVRAERTIVGGAAWSDPEAEAVSPEGQSQPRHVVIIARHYASLFEYVQGRFACEDNVEVVLDRRAHRDRRRRSARIRTERRAGERRRRQHIDDALRVESMQVVTICQAPTG
jgi:hypothetical protein